MYESKEHDEEWEHSIKLYQFSINNILISLHNLLRFWLIPIYVPDIRLVPEPSTDPIIFKLFTLSNNDMNIEVLPVYRSPSIDCLCPLPTGNILSIILNPIINESFTLALSAILTPLFNRLLLLLYSINIE